MTTAVEAPDTQAAAEAKGSGGSDPVNHDFQ